MAGAGLIMPFWWSADDANLCNSDDHQTMPTYAILIMMTPKLPCLLLSIVPRQLFWIWSNIHHEELEVFYWIEGSHQILFPPLCGVRLHILWGVRMTCDPGFVYGLTTSVTGPAPRFVPDFNLFPWSPKASRTIAFLLRCSSRLRTRKSSIFVWISSRAGQTHPAQNQAHQERERGGRGERPICNISLFISATSATRWSSRHCNPKGLLN